jgi:hypothetical protein
MDREVLSLVTNVGTMAMMMFIADRVYRLVWHWLDLQHGQETRLTEAIIRGPKPILLSRVIREQENTPA